MALTDIQQFEQALKSAHNVLVVVRPQPNHDEIVSACAIAEWVKHRSAQATIVSSNYAQPSALKFIPATSSIDASAGQLHDFSISVAVGSTGVQNVRHELVDGTLTFHLTPNIGVVTAANVVTHTSEFRFDAIIAIGAPDLASLGDAYTQNTALFNAVPIINIDCAAANEQFGHLNLVDITCTSVAEVVYAIFRDTHADITQPTAQLLLTGVIAATRSFKFNAVNARTLQTASALISLGADRELVVHHLYRQRSIAALKLWGAVLSHLQSDPQQPLMWSSLTRDDFVRAGATERDLHDFIDELIYTAPGVKVFALIFEKGDDISVIVDAQKPYSASALVSGFSETTGGVGRTTSTLGGFALADATARVVNVLRAKMRG
ncbi:MAG: hypothetical protein A2848_03565 [Candidatus Magasanikbacteria bacterium RIFCSPHIGHO2_01_FULL_50_8]|uniref:DDH domain-containing protein n=2 Tax=Candidatus Magasanikiibacteriota TaxID=1752731 RepID=A0A1F6LSL9_9BACT|nr:MAG: hypothetical protein A2848_03565 [Candidatus Magasanikbacteria bacterium RIFCSPHIGHO2_01_FULL_50_8]OGH68024.1 MAG: hypothetical protein A3C15_00520 [Candidatus Magasanikbacteria bacterium RIFCSPHIGHO2_02_FULL_50_9b]